jgi:hypothetical protein
MGQSASAEAAGEEVAVRGEKRTGAIMVNGVTR